MQPCPVNQIEQKHTDQTEQQHDKVRVEFPQVRKYRAAVVGQGRNSRKYLLVSQTEDYGARKKAEHARDQIIQFSLAAPGGAGSRSVAGQGHPDPEDQSTHQVAGNIRCWHV